MKEQRREYIDISEPDHWVELEFQESVHTPGTERFTLLVTVDGGCKLRVTGVDKDKLLINGLDKVLKKEDSG